MWNCGQTIDCIICRESVELSINCRAPPDIQIPLVGEQKLDGQQFITGKRAVDDSKWRFYGG